MATYECSGCGAFETLTFVPDCCSSCRSPMVPVDGTAAADRAFSLDACLEDLLAIEYEDAAAPGPTRSRTVIAVLAGALFLIGLTVVAAMSSGMEACEQAHSFDTCFSILNP